MSHELTSESSTYTRTEVLPSEQRFEGGVKKETYTLEAGWYGIELGFPEINKSEKRWLHTGNDDIEYRFSHSFELDTEHPLFQGLVARLRERVRGITHTKQLIMALDEILETTIKSGEVAENEHNEKLSDIIKSGKATCASKTLVAGLLVQEVFGAKASTIHGQHGPVKESMCYPFLHEWLRFQIGNTVFLYDPMYHYYQIVKLVDDEVLAVDENYDFSRNGVGAYTLANIADKLSANIAVSPQITLVKKHPTTHGDKSHHVFLQQNTALAGQLFGLYADFYVPKKTALEIQDGNYIISNIPGSDPTTGPIVKVPLQKILKGEFSREG